MPRSIPTGKHTVTEEELKSCKALGFVVYSPGAKLSLVDFLKANFPGLELSKFLTEIDDLFKPMSGKRLTKIIGYNESDPFELVLQYYSEDHDDEIHGLAFSRTFIRDAGGKTAVHDFFRIPKNFRNLGHGKIMLNYGLQQYLNIGVDIIKVHAALADGGFVWARAHFVAVRKREVSLILASAKLGLPREEFKKVKEVYDNYYNADPNGIAFPINKWSLIPGMKGILQNSDWHGEIDLNNQELLFKFTNYVTGQK